MSWLIYFRKEYRAVVARSENTASFGEMQARQPFESLSQRLHIS